MFSSIFLQVLSSSGIVKFLGFLFLFLENEVLTT